jgi:hypothetical protein
MPPGYPETLKAALHRIPDLHPVDRTTEPAKRSGRILTMWGRASIGVAAALALFFSISLQAPSDDLEGVASIELYELGYVDMELLIEWSDPDSLQFVELSIDDDLLLDYTNPEEDYYQL